MSEVAKPTEETPAPTTTTTTSGTDSAPVASPTPAAATSEPTTTSDTITSAAEPASATSKDTSVQNGDAKPDASSASEAVFGYKSPGLIHSLLFSKRVFWFSDEPISSDSLETYVRAEKSDNSHPNAAWASETGKGLLFFAKRTEDKTTPAGIINLSEISDLGKEGSNEFSFKLNGHKHAFQASSAAERDNWVTAIETKSAEAKASKEGVVGGEGYKKNLDKYSAMGVGAAAAAASRANLSKSKERKDGTSRTRSETKAKEAGKKDKSDTNSSSSSDQEKKDKKSKSRSQSRKRSSIFGLLGKKDDAEEKKDVKKEEKTEDNAEKKHEKELVKADEKPSQEAVKDEAVPEKDSAKDESKPMLGEKDAETKDTPEPAESAAAAPTAAIASQDTKADEIKPETPAPKSTETQDKKAAKRTSIFGMSLFGGKKDVTSPSAEKTQSDGTPATSAKDNEILPVSETAPKIDEPIESKPIDTVAVTAPVDSAIAAHDTPSDTAPAEQTSQPAAKGVSSPSHKSNIMGFFKRQDSKAEAKKEDRSEEPVMSPTTADTTAVSESPVTATAEEKPTTDKKRRTSFFNNFGTIKEKKSPEPTSEGEATKGEQKKSPLPQKLGGLFRRPSKAVPSGEKQVESTPAGTEAGTAATAGEAAQPAATEPFTTSGPSTMANEVTEQTPATTTSPVPEVKASA